MFNGMSQNGRNGADAQLDISSLGQGATNSQSGPTLQQANVMARQLQMMQSQTAARLRDLQTLASLPAHLQGLAAQRLGLTPGTLTPQFLHGQMTQLQTLLRQYQMQLVQVQMQQQRLQQQDQQQQQSRAHAVASHLGQAGLSGSGPPGSLDGGYASQPARQSVFTTGDRFRNTTNNKRRKRDESPDGIRGGGNLDAHPTRESNRRRKKVNYAEAEALADLTDDDERDVDSDEERLKNKQKTAIAAFDDTSDLDDEVEKILVHRDVEGVEPVPGDPWATREFFVKWRRWSYVHCSWDTRETLMQLAGYKRVQNYMKRVDNYEKQKKFMTREEVELRDVENQMEYELALQHQVVERIVTERVERDGVRKYLCKWQGLPYSENTWEAVEDVINYDGKRHIDEYLAREQRIMKPPQSVEMARRMFLQKHRGLREQPEFLQGGQLRDYQLASLNWMIYSWLQNSNVILADEMGLGKTVQCASVVGYFSEVLNIYGPFLVVVPLSTVPNWIKEFRKWIPNVNAVVYIGDTKSREVIREFEFYSNRRSDRELKFEALITTYELVLKDADILSNIRWNFLVVDEAHRLKNNESALYKELVTWQFKNKLLVTGTPLQNTVKELWALLHFLEPAKFPSSEEFETKYDLNDAQSVTELHTVLKPHLLRRVIKDVEKSLPPKNERILRVDMTPLQRQYYKWVLQRNFKELNKGSRAQVTLLNIISDLKKCCNHPFLFESVEEEYKGHDEHSMIDRLVRTSGKMVLLDKLLSRLKAAGHRVLLFSQMVRMLDIISDYMRMKGWLHQRLDGSTPPQQRHQAMEQFNADGSRDFAFLLSTRAGGLGINLATADTVIIFDSDWNPQNDLQAMSRAHRIGQKSLVNIYRFVTMGSVEEDILQRAKRKMVLDHLIIQRMDTSGRTVLGGDKSGKDMFDKTELAAILRFGAENLFKEDQDEAAAAETQQRDQQLYEEDIDQILARAEVVDNRVQEEANEKKNELLSAFNVATFKNEEDDATFWSRLIADDAQRGGSAAVDDDDGEPQELMPRAARLRAADALGEGSRGGGRRKSARDRHADAPQGVTIDITDWPPSCDRDGNPADVSDPSWERPDGLSRRDAHIFLRGMRRYARIEKLDVICADVGSVMEEAPPEARYGVWHSIIRACKDALAAVEMQGFEPKDAQVNFFGNNIKALELSQHTNAMRLLTLQISQLSDPYEAFRLDADAQCAPPKWAAVNNWTVKDDSMLLLGSYLYGICHWDRMAADERLGLGSKMDGAVKDGPKVGDKQFPQASHMDTRVTALLKKIERSRNPDAIQVRPGRKSKKHLQGAPERRTGTRGGRGRGRGGRGGANARDAGCAAAMDEVLSELKKLRLLGRKDDIAPQRVIAKTRKYLLAIGDRITNLPDGVSGSPNHSDLWDYVSDFTENDCDGAKLRSLYEKLVSKRFAPDDAGAEEEVAAVAGGRGVLASAGDAEEEEEDEEEDAYGEQGDEDDDDEAGGEEEDYDPEDD